MLLKVLFLANIILSEAFGFQHNLNHSISKLEDFVWFEEPDFTAYQHQDFQDAKHIEKDESSSKWEYFINFQPEASVEDEKTSDFKKEYSWTSEDEIFAKYFFVNRWKK